MDKVLWIIAHGSKNKDWVELVDRIVVGLSSPFPIVVSFLEHVPNRLIEDGIKQIDLLHIKEIIAIPLFISSASNHIEEIRDILTKYKKDYRIHMSSPIDSHPLVIRHLIQLAYHMSTEQANEALVLVGHGSSDPTNYLEWVKISNDLIDEIKKESNYSEVSFATILPETLTQELERIRNKSIIVIPLFLSKGYYTEKVIPRVLADYHVKYNGYTYSDGDLLYEWLDFMIHAFQNNRKDVYFKSI